MRRIDKNGLEIGYWVHPEFVGRGYATRAAEALTTLGLGLPERDPHRDSSRQVEPGQQSSSHEAGFQARGRSAGKT